jgi:hypothetical protein
MYPGGKQQGRLRLLEPGQPGLKLRRQRRRSRNQPRCARAGSPSEGGFGGGFGQCRMPGQVEVIVRTQMHIGSPGSTTMRGPDGESSATHSRHWSRRRNSRSCSSSRSARVLCDLVELFAMV